MDSVAFMGTGLLVFTHKICLVWSNHKWPDVNTDVNAPNHIENTLDSDHVGHIL